MGPQDVAVIIPAAGSGKRMGAQIPKPFLQIGDRTVIEHTLSIFDDPDHFSQIIVAVPGEMLDQIRNLISIASISVPVSVVEGGVERMYSIRNAIAHIHENARFVAVHDAVRPLASQMLIHRLLDAVRVHGAVIPGIQVTDTIKQVNESGEVVATPPRNRLRAIQTPQMFRKDIFVEAYNKAVSERYIGTDDASLLEYYGTKVYVVEGETTNIKLTYQEDLGRAEKILSGRQSRLL